MVYKSANWLQNGQILVEGKARGGENAQRTTVRERFSTTRNAAFGYKMLVLKPVLHVHAAIDMKNLTGNISGLIGS